MIALAGSLVDTLAELLADGLSSLLVALSRGRFPFRRLLWVDCTAAATAGVTVIALSGWLAALEGLPRGLLLFTGAVNLLYGSYSFSLAVRARRSMGMIRLLVFANLAWVPVCVLLLGAFSSTATPFAYLHFLGEAIFVGGLGLLEWRYRDLLEEAGR